MKRIIPVVLALGLIIGASLPGAADETSANPSANPTPSAAPTSPGNASYSPSGTSGPTSSAGVAQPLPADWKKVKGTVESTDPSMNQVKIKDETGNLSLVNVDSNVVIKKDGKNVQITDLQAGDRITLTRRNAPMTDQNKG